MRKLAVGLVVISVLAIGLAAAFLPRIVEFAAIRAIGMAGLGQARLTVSDIDWTSATVTGIEVGAAPPLRIGRLSLAYDIDGLSNRPIEAIDIEGGELTLRVGPDGVEIPALDPLMRAEAGEDGAGWRIEQINISQASLNLQTPWADLGTTVEGGLSLPGPGVFDGVFTFTGEAVGALPDSFPVSGGLGFRITGSDIEFLEADIAADPPPMPQIAVRTLHLRAVVDEQRLTATASAHADEATAELRFQTVMPLGLNVAEFKGHGRLQGHFDGNLYTQVPTPVAWDLPFYIEGGSLFAQGILDHSRGRLHVWSETRIPHDLALDRATSILFVESDLEAGLVPGLAEPAAATLNGRWADGYLTADGRLDGPFGDIRASLHLPVDLTSDPRTWEVHGSYAADLKPSRTLDIPLSLGLRGSVLSRAGDLSTRARVRSSWFESDVTASTTWRQPDDISATFEGRSKPALHPWMPRGIGFSGSARYASARADLTTSLTLPGAEGGIRASAKVDLGRGTALPAINAVGDVVVDVSGLLVLGLEAPVTLAGKIRGGLRQGTARVDVVEPIEFHAAEAGIALRLTDPAPPILRADLSEGRLKAAAISPKHIAATVQGFPLLLDDLVLNLGETTLAWQDANLRHDAKRPEFTPLRISGRIAWPDGPLRFSAKASAKSGQAVLEASGRHDADAARGMARVKLHPVRFLPGLMQPRDLLPVQGKRVEKVTGSLSAEGPVRWRDGELTSDLVVRADDLSLTAEGTRIEGLSGDVLIVRPWPLATAPGQTLLAKSIDPGLPLSAAKTVIEVSPRGRINIDEISAGFAGGRLHAGGLSIDPAAKDHQAELNLAGLNVTDLLKIAELDDASGTGTLAGKVPVTLKDGEITVAGGLLETQAPGIIRYAPEVPPAALQGGGQGVSLMLSALRNFHYEVMRLTLNGNLGKDLTAVLHIKGKNPDFMDGYPFEFNLNVSGALGQLLRQGLATYQIPESIGRSLKDGTKP